ncbi:GATA type zinc finger protein asd-4 [Nosema granulosis]|uniref:GATA type zinc finger protein asd-4 n=1 Tax=Nosema granulosis TaxID=83296 RepID=A0A9P6H140_9MICR|nr:GATA type zinc finger protein asd-4 [Nosema granulosis]
MYTKQGICSNCNTTVTPLWRRGVDGSYLCNACGLYYKIHKKHRPTELKTDNFRQRNRFRRDFLADTNSIKHYHGDKSPYDHRMAHINFYDTFYEINKKTQKEGRFENIYTSFMPRGSHSNSIISNLIAPKNSIKDNSKGKNTPDEEENNEAIAIKVLLSLSKIHPY